MSGKKQDLSAFGVSFNDWVDVKFDVRDSAIHIYINQGLAFEMKARLHGLRFVGMIFRFQGTGRVNLVRISRHNGDILHEEKFDRVQ